VPIVTDQAICIRQWDWSETSQTVSLFGRESGVIRGVAKGSKREKSQFSGGLEVLTRGEFMASIKNTDNLALLTAWDLQETFPAARATLSAFYAGMTLLDLVHHAVRDNDPHPPLYDALLLGLRQLGSEAADRRAVLEFLWTVLAETGHQPEVWQDVRTSEPLPPAPVYAFAPNLGGLTRDGASPFDAATPVGDLWRVRSETIELLRSLETPEAEAALYNTSDATVERATRLLALYFRDVFGCEPASLRRIYCESA
jgi:DNA repair protein RecO (recombination protein O)